MNYNKYYSRYTYLPDTSTSILKVLPMDPDEWTSIYIPYIDSSYTRDYLAYIFEHKYNIGRVKQIDFVRNPSKHNKRKDEYSAFIHFEYWFYTDFACFLRYYLNKHPKYDIANYFRYFNPNLSNQTESDHFYIMINRSNKYAANPMLSSSLSSEEGESFMNKIHIYTSITPPKLVSSCHL
jgi:hypothetical protein